MRDGKRTLADEYVRRRGATAFEEFEADFNYILKLLKKFHPVTPETKIYEVGAGLGWFEVICAKRGLSCSAIEISPVFRDAALELARRHRVEVDIELGSIEDADLGSERYDVIIAHSVLEHVRHYGRAFAKIHAALRPDGVFYLDSTNKFSFRSGEQPDPPLYGWFPYSIRERIRVSRQGPDIVASAGIDFNQFTYWGLCKHLRSLGFSRILDRVDFVDPGDRPDRSLAKSVAIRLVKAVPPLKLPVRAFAAGNTLICIK